MKAVKYEYLGDFDLPYRLLGYPSNKAMIDELGEDFPHMLKKWNTIIRKAQEELYEAVDRNKLIYPPPLFLPLPEQPEQPRRVIIRIKKKSNK
jgi:hypothetical protein